VASSDILRFAAASFTVVDSATVSSATTTATIDASDIVAQSTSRLAPLPAGLIAGARRLLSAIA